MGADAFFQQLVPGARLRTGLAFSFLVAIGVLGVALASFLLRVVDLGGLRPLVVAGQALLDLGEPVVGGFADLAIAILLAVDSSFVLAHTSTLLENVQLVRALALLVYLNQRRPAIAKV